MTSSTHNSSSQLLLAPEQAEEQQSAQKSGATPTTELANPAPQNAHQQHYLATHDLLTGLHNEKMFIDRVTHEINYCERYHFQFAAMLLDLNNFRLVNEEFGISFGDLVLREAAKRIKSCVRSTDTVARWKADQFLLLLTNITTAQEVSKIANKIMATLTHPVKLDNQDYFIQASVAICLYPEDGSTYEILNHRLRQTLPRVKLKYSPNCQFYNLDVTQRVHLQTNVENELKRSIFHNDIHLQYQPIVDVRRGEVHHLKASLTWKSEIIPDSVLRMLTEDLMEQPPVDGLDDWMLYSACEQIQQWDKTGVKNYNLAVEISAQQFMNFNLAEKILHCVRDNGIDPGRLILEIKEQTILINKNQALDYLTRLKQLGVQITLCNFGHGQTHLSLLKELPVDHIKLAPSLIGNIEHNKADQAIVHGIIALTTGLNKPAIVPGIENIDQLNILSELNCLLMQGTIIHNAMSADAVAML